MDSCSVFFHGIRFLHIIIHVFQHFTRWAYFTRFLNAVAALLMTGRARGPQNPMDPPPELRTLCLGTESLKPTRWVNVRNWRLWVYGWEVNEETWFFGNMLILEMTFFQVIFWRSYMFWGVIFLRLLYTFWVICFRLVFGVNFFTYHLDLPHPPTQLVLSVWLFKASFVWGLLKICGCLSQESRENFPFLQNQKSIYIFICKAHSPTPQVVTPVAFPQRLKPWKIKWKDYCFRAKIYQVKYPLGCICWTVDCEPCWMNTK